MAQVELEEQDGAAGEVEVELEEGDAAAEGADGDEDADAGEAEVEVEGEDMLIAEEEAEDPEPEEDDDAAFNKLARIPHQASFLTREATPNAICTAAGVLSSLSQGPFARLLAGARADTGVKQGRYLFEVQVLELS